MTELKDELAEAAPFTEWRVRALPPHSTMVVAARDEAHAREIAGKFAEGVVVIDSRIVSAWAVIGYAG